MFISLKEAATRLEMTDPPKHGAAVLRQAIARGSLHATRMGRDWFVTEEEVERYRRDHRRVRA